MTSTRAEAPAADPAADPATDSDATTGAGPARQRWVLPAHAVLLAATAALYLLGLSANGWANAYYSAAAQAGSESWTAFFFGSLDAGNAITVDKPPASIWAMALSVRLFGLSSFAILLPQALMGVATVHVLALTVRRYAGAAAGLLAGAVLALTPVAVLMFRFNNPDALLTLLMVLAAATTLRAVERGSVRWMALTGVLVGLGFLTKTLQVLLVVPALGLVWLAFADTTLRRRLVGAAAAVGTALASAGWWVALVELLPADLRPYVGGSQTDSFLELTFGYNGLGRLSGEEAGAVGGGNGWGGTGLLRMFSDTVGGQISWLLPSALLLLAAGLWWRAGSPRTDLRRAAYALWGGWLVVTGLVFSLMAGIFHEYYTVALAPAVAAIVGAGAVEAWERRDELVGRAVLAAATLAAGAWGAWLLLRAEGYGGLAALVGVAGVVGALGWLALDLLPRVAVAAAVVISLLAGFGGPTAWSLQTATTAQSGSIVTAGPTVASGDRGGPRGAGGPGGAGGPDGGRPGGQPGGAGGGGLLDAATPSAAVVAALSADAEQFTWVAATVGAQNAAGLQLATELPVMAIGGFNGTDPSPTLAEFQDLVAAGEVHYLADGGSGGRGGPGGDGEGTGTQIQEWAAQNYVGVDLDGATYYDLTQPLAGAGATEVGA